MSNFKGNTASAHRSNVKNPNNSAYVADRANRSSLGHTNVPPPAPVKVPTTQAVPESPTKE